MSDELIQNDDLGLTYEPARFKYSSPRRPRPELGQPFPLGDVRSLADVPYRPVSWFWTGRIPRNKLTVIEGPPQSAKSLVALELAARASRGEVLPGDDAMDFCESRVLLVSGHDDLSDTVLPRIRRAVGTLSNFSQLSQVALLSFGDDEPSDRRRLTLPGDIGHLEDSLSFAEADVLIVDPLTGFCKSGRDVAVTLELLEALASRSSTPIITTLSAKTGRNAIGRWESRPEFSDAPARCVWGIVADDDEPGRWLFVPVRMTFATPAEGMAFRIVNGRIAWEPLPVLPLSERDEPVAWLWSILQEGALRSTYVERQAREFGISAKMLRRARRILKVVIDREGARESSVSLWRLPETAPQASGEPAVLAAEPAGRIAGPTGAGDSDLQSPLQDAKPESLNKRGQIID